MDEWDKAEQLELDEDAIRKEAYERGWNARQSEVDKLERILRATEETTKALRNGEEAPHYCAWCMSRIKNGGDPEHMLECDKAPFATLTRKLADSLEEADQLKAWRDAVLARDVLAGKDTRL